MVVFRSIIKIQETEHFHLANNLRRKHIYFHAQKMKVMLASQLFSNSVADAIFFCCNELKYPQFKGAEATIKFIRIINNLFDIFNSRSINEYSFKKPLNTNNKNEIFSYLEENGRYLKSLKCTDGLNVIRSPRKLGFLGLIGCYESLKIFSATLIETNKLAYIPFYKFSQDHLELLFCNIRSHGGCNNNPTARQFKAIYKKLLTHIQLKQTETGNCASLKEISILHCSSSVQKINNTTGRRFADDVEYNVSEIDNEELEIAFIISEFSEFSSQIIGYISGYVVHILLKKLHCDTCISALIAHQKSHLHKFVVAKDKGEYK